MKKKSFENQDKREKERQLSEAERKRLERFESLSEDMARRGYRRQELTISIVKANIFAIVLFFPVAAAGFVLYVMKNGLGSPAALKPTDMLVILAGMAALVVVHELLHGVGWAAFSEHHFKDIEFGFIKQYMTPYCTCCVPLSKKQYICGAILPLLVLGVVPMIAGILCGSLTVLWLGIIMTDSAAGDIMIVWNILRYKSPAAQIVYMDHPTQGGGVIFEK